MIVTFDTNVLLSATLWEGSVAQKLLYDLIRQNVKIFSTTEIVGKVLEFVTLVVPSMKVDVVKDDPDDNPIVECAIESNSKYIVTYDPHLLMLKEYKKIQIIRPEIARAIF